MSRAPIMSGMSRFPKQPISTGVIAKKIMTSPCVVKSCWYIAGPITPPLPRKSSPPTTGTGR